MKLYVGTSGFSYKEWKGSFYPEKIRADAMLAYCSSQFLAVEINNTFHRMPKPGLLESWASQVPPEFRFVLKGSQSITHMRRLNNVEDAVVRLLAVSSVLHMRLGALLFQLPPNMKEDVSRLDAFLGQFPGDVRVAMEFRHQSWFDDDVFNSLRQHNAALCIAEAENDLDIPFVATANWGCLRLRLPEYSDSEIKSKAKDVLSQAWDDAYIFFKHEDEARGPRMARRFVELASPGAAKKTSSRKGGS